MGVCLYFTSAEMCDAKVEWAVRSHVAPFRDHQPWLLCEPPHFLPYEADGRLRGRTKLNLHPSPDELAEALAVEAERNDVQELIHRLCECSSRHSLTWELRVEDDRLGTIRDGVAESGVRRAIELMEKMVGPRPRLTGER